MLKVAWNIVFSLGLVLVVSTVFGQYKVKKGIVYKDDKPTGKVKGKISAFRYADLTFSGTNDTPIVSVTEGLYSLKNPFFSSYAWFNIKFLDSGKELKIDNSQGKRMGCAKEECILEKLLVPSGIVFEGEVIQNQDSIINKYDYSLNLKSDTIEKREEEYKLIQSLKSTPLIERNKEREISITGNSESEFRVFQEGVQIAVMKIVEDKNSLVHEKVYHVYLPKRPQDLALAFARISINNTPVIFTLIDKKWREINLLEQNSIELTIATFLVKNGYL
ncbi:MAG: hypothetical protein K2U26_00770 [Cyclobacteriaceae bacterium]|nr:hypothetical protein [Cyclobacteriaceae bacterium]